MARGVHDRENRHRIHRPGMPKLVVAQAISGIKTTAAARVASGSPCNGHRRRHRTKDVGGDAEVEVTRVW